MTVDMRRTDHTVPTPSDLTVEGVRRRLERNERWRLEGEKRAAVALVFRTGPGGAVELLLIRRAEDRRDPWSGHMAFPGGRVERGDSSSRAAALRETSEEIGLDLSLHGRQIGRLSDVTAVAHGRRLGLVIESFVFELLHDVPLTANVEVQEIVWIPLAFFLETGNRSSLEYSFEDRVLDLPCYRWRGRVVWGLTLRMLDDLLEAVGGPSFTDWPERNLR